MDIADELRRRYVNFGEVWRPQVETPQMIRARLMSAMPLTAARMRTSLEVWVGPQCDIERTDRSKGKLPERGSGSSHR
jgi:hypothetical protein